MNYKGVIIEESLSDKLILKSVKTLNTRIEQVTPKHKTPWLKRWTLRTVEIKENVADSFAKTISNSIETLHKSWYVDFKNNKYHFIVYPGKIFRVDFTNSSYKEARDWGISIGIPKYQMQFERLKR